MQIRPLLPMAAAIGLPTDLAFAQRWHDRSLSAVPDIEMRRLVEGAIQATDLPPASVAFFRWLDVTANRAAVRHLFTQCIDVSSAHFHQHAKTMVAPVLSRADCPAHRVRVETPPHLRTPKPVVRRLGAPGVPDESTRWLLRAVHAWLRATAKTDGLVEHNMVLLGASWDDCEADLITAPADSPRGQVHRLCHGADGDTYASLFAVADRAPDQMPLLNGEPTQPDQRYRFSDSTLFPTFESARAAVPPGASGWVYRLSAPAARLDVMRADGAQADDCAGAVYVASSGADDPHRWEVDDAAAINLQAGFWTRG